MRRRWCHAGTTAAAWPCAGHGEILGSAEVPRVLPPDKRQDGPGLLSSFSGARRDRCVAVFCIWVCFSLLQSFLLDGAGKDMISAGDQHRTARFKEELFASPAFVSRFVLPALILFWSCPRMLAGKSGVPGSTGHGREGARRRDQHAPAVAQAPRRDRPSRALPRRVLVKDARSEYLQ